MKKKKRNKRLEIPCKECLLKPKCISKYINKNAGEYITQIYKCDMLIKYVYSSKCYGQQCKRANKIVKLFNDHTKNKEFYMSLNYENTM